MGPDRQVAPLEVVRSEAGSGGSGLHLAGELDLHTVTVLEYELERAHDQSPPDFIDVSGLSFIDIAGLRALLRALGGGADAAARLTGATGTVRRLFELVHQLSPSTSAVPA